MRRKLCRNVLSYTIILLLAGCGSGGSTISNADEISLRKHVSDLEYRLSGQNWRKVNPMLASGFVYIAENDKMFKGSKGASTYYGRISRVKRNHRSYEIIILKFRQEKPNQVMTICTVKHHLHGKPSHLKWTSRITWVRSGSNWKVSRIHDVSNRK